MLFNFVAKIGVNGTGPVPDGDARHKEDKEEKGKKERSVLQAKLTKLAIQIGYAGKIK